MRAAAPPRDNQPHTRNVPQLYTDPLTGRRVVIAQDRAGRPNEFAKGRPEAPRDTAPRADCPFCPGNEEHTPPTLLQLGEGAAWRRRVIANKYPMCAAPPQHGDPGVLAGAHEVIIESPHHVLGTAELGVEGLAEVLAVYAARLQHWRDDPRFPFRLVFKNVGPTGGASLAHLHSQFMALPHLSVQLQQEQENIARTNAPPQAWPRWLEEQLSDGRRLVAQDDRFVVFCPRVSRGPLETWVMPRERAPWFEETPDLGALARLLLPVIARLEHRIAPAGYNMMLVTAPVAAEYADVMHWRLELLPRVASLAGFELATSVYLNTMTAADSAAELRG